MDHSTLKELIKKHLPHGLGAQGDEVKRVPMYPERNLHVLLAVTGSVASIKAPLIVQEFLKYEKVDVQVIATQNSRHFFDEKSIERDSLGEARVWTDEMEWAGWKEMGDPVLHIELRRWVDIVLVAPCSANTLSQLVQGSCTNLLTSFLRALPTTIPVLLFPAMNTHMYNHPLTKKHLDFVSTELGYHIHGPIGKLLACGDIGIGAMTEWSDIVQLVADRCNLLHKPKEITD